MNCQEFWNSMPQRGEAIDEAQTIHLTECPVCAAQLAPHRALANGLRMLAVDSRQVEAPARVEAGLTAAFRSQAGFRRQTAIRQSYWTPVLAWASAAAAMIALAAFLVHGWQPNESRPDSVATPHRTSAPNIQTAAYQEDDTGLGDGFIRVPNSARIEPNEDVNVVRVEVPGSAMIAMGFAVGEERASETVLADVALGADGMARAVRFVTDSGSF